MDSIGHFYKWNKQLKLVIRKVFYKCYEDRIKQYILTHIVARTLFSKMNNKYSKTKNKNKKKTLTFHWQHLAQLIYVLTLSHF